MYKGEARETTGKNETRNCVKDFFLINKAEKTTIRSLAIKMRQKPPQSQEIAQLAPKG